MVYAAWSPANHSAQTKTDKGQRPNKEKSNDKVQTIKDKDKVQKL